MSWFDAVILGLVQGITEFLPVSSSGHLVIAQEVLGVESPGVFFEVLVHVGTLVSVVWVYRATVLDLLAGAVRGEAEAWSYGGRIALATFPAAFIGYLLADDIGAAFDSAVFVGAMLLVTAAFLWSTGAALVRDPEGEVDWVRGFEMGFAQAFAILPGISRSGATVTTALWRGVDPDEAARFSFLMSIPAILGAGVLELGGAVSGGFEVAFGPAAAAFVVAAISGILAIRLFVRMLRNRTFPAFAPYVAVVGAGFVVYGLLS